MTKNDKVLTLNTYEMGYINTIQYVLVFKCLNMD